MASVPRACKPSPDRRFQCELCGKAFVQNAQLRKHLRTHTGERPYRCGSCSKGFLRRSNMLRHEETHLEVRPIKEKVDKEDVAAFNFGARLPASSGTEGEQKFCCSECSYSSEFKGNLDRHLMTHTGERPYPCQLCDKRFARPADVRRHLLVHTREGFRKGKDAALDCDVCNQSPSECPRHPERKFHCPHPGCHYAAQHKGNLEQHLTTHSGERPFPCELCGRAFARKHHLARHLLTHTGEKPFVCGTCGKSFTRITTLRTHEGSTGHTGETSTGDE